MADALEANSAGQDPSRFYCPFPGCKRSFAELWRLKVHYRAPPDIRGSGKERGHGTELTHCPKCGKGLKQGKHHVGCSAGKTAGRQASKRSRAAAEEAPPSKAAIASSPKQIVRSPASPAARHAIAKPVKQENAASDVLLQLQLPSSRPVRNGFNVPHSPASGASSLDHAAATALMPAFGAQPGHGDAASSSGDTAMQQQPPQLPAFMQPATSTSAFLSPVPERMTVFMQQHQPQQQQQLNNLAGFMQQSTASMPAQLQRQLSQPVHGPGGSPAFMQQPLQQQQGLLQQALSSPPGMLPSYKPEQQAFIMQPDGSSAGTASTSQPLNVLLPQQQQQQQQHAQQQQQEQHRQQEFEDLSSVFDDVDRLLLMDEQPPSPPPLPPDFPVMNLAPPLFNFSQFDASHRMPAQPPQSVPMPSGLSPAMVPANGLWAPDTTFEHSSDGDLMQLLFGAPDQPPTMATIHLHHFIADDDEEDDSAAALQLPSPAAMDTQGSTQTQLDVGAAAGNGPSLLPPLTAHDFQAGHSVPGCSTAAAPGAVSSPAAPAPMGIFGGNGMCGMGMLSFGSGPGAANIAAAAAMGPPPDVGDFGGGMDWAGLGLDDSMEDVQAMLDGSAGGLLVNGEQQQQEQVASPSGGLEAVTTQMQHIKVEQGAFSPAGTGHVAAGMQQQGLWHCGDARDATTKAALDADPLQALLFSTCE